MTKTIRLTALALCMAVLTAFSAPAFAAEQPLSFAIVDMNKIMHKAVAAEGIRKDVGVKYKQFQAEIDKMEKQLHADKEALDKKMASLSEAEREKQEKAFRARIDKIERLMQDRKQTLTSANNNSMRKLMEEVTKILGEIAKAKGYDAILTQEAVILAAKTMDITEEVLTRLNKDVKKIDIDWSTKPPAKKK